MKEKKDKIIFVECKNCKAKGKLVLPEGFKWSVIPCPLCYSENLKELKNRKQLSEKEKDFEFNPRGVEEEKKEKK